MRVPLSAGHCDGELAADALKLEVAVHEPLRLVEGVIVGEGETVLDIELGRPKVWVLLAVAATDADGEGVPMAGDEEGRLEYRGGRQGRAAPACAASAGGTAICPSADRPQQATRPRRDTEQA